MPEVHADELFGAVPEKGGFQARGAGFLWGRARKGAVSGTSVDSILPWHPKSVQSEDGHLQRCGRIHFNFVVPQSEIGVIWQKSTEVRKE